MLNLCGHFTLFDDDSTREKLTIMNKWEAMLDDERNPVLDWEGEVEDYIQPGKTYEVTLTIRENVSGENIMGAER